MSDFELSSTGVLPPPLDTVACGVPLVVLEDLVLKHLHLQGTATLELLARETRLPLNVMREIVITLLSQQTVAWTKTLDHMVAPAVGASESVTLTSTGRARACEAFAVSRYLGPADRKSVV